MIKWGIDEKKEITQHINNKFIVDLNHLNTTNPYYVNYDQLVWNMINKLTTENCWFFSFIDWQKNIG